MIQQNLLDDRGVSLVFQPERGARRAAQRVLIAPARSSVGMVGQETGRGFAMEYVIVGNADLEIEVGDRFQLPAGYGQRNGKVVFVENAVLASGYETKQARAKVVQ